VTAFKPQAGDVWTLPIGLAADAQDIGGLGRGSTFGAFAERLGDAWDTTGEITLAGGFIRVQVRIWAAAGVRIAGTCSRGACDETTTVSNVTLSPPFVGQDGSLGIGATRADLEASVGTGADDDGVIVYGEPSQTGDALGVVYVRDTQCVERAAAFVFNYFDPT